MLCLVKEANRSITDDFICQLSSSHGNYSPGTEKVAKFISSMHVPGTITVYSHERHSVSNHWQLICLFSHMLMLSAVKPWAPYIIGHVWWEFSGHKGPVMRKAFSVSWHYHANIISLQPRGFRASTITHPFLPYTDPMFNRRRAQ